MTYPMLTAAEALQQGSTPSTFFTIARFNERLAERERNPVATATARRARTVARELAGLLGMDVGGRKRPARTGANDNTKRRGRARAA